MLYEIIGKYVGNLPTVESGTFKKKEIIVKTDEQFPQNLKFELQNDKIQLLDTIQIGQTIKILFSLRGREWYSQKDQETVYFQSWVVWKFFKFENGLTQPLTEAPKYEFNFRPASEVFGDNPDDDLPF